MSEPLQISIACDLALVRSVVESLKAYLQAQGCCPEDVIDCELAAAEACNNAVLYAPASARHLPVHIQVSCPPAEIEIRVSDHTQGFELPLKPVLPPLGSERGRGLFVIMTVMGQVEYLRGQGTNTLVLHRKRRG